MDRVLAPSAPANTNDVVDTAPDWIQLIAVFGPASCCICRRQLDNMPGSMSLIRATVELWIQHFRCPSCSGPADMRDGKIVG